MLRTPVLLVLAAALVAFASPNATAQDADPEEVAAAIERALAIEERLVSSLESVTRSSVTVLVKKSPRDKEGQVTGEPRLAGCGSGVLVKRAGKIWVVTNHHVAGDADALSVKTWDGLEREVELHETLERFDIAVLRFDERQKDLVAVSIRARASDELAEGQWVVATGSPFFLALDGTPVATVGVVSGKDRVLGGHLLYGRAIQHDAAVNPGNSGGPLWNLSGELVGINGMIVTRTSRRAGPSNSGASFSIPIDQVEAHLDRLLDESRQAEAGFLGVTYATFTGERGRAQGAQVTRVHPQSPMLSARKGFGRGVVIRSVSARGRTHKIRTAGDLTNTLAILPPGTPVRIQYRSEPKGDHFTWSGKLTNPPEPAKKPR